MPLIRLIQTGWRDQIRVPRRPSRGRERARLPGSCIATAPPARALGRLSGRQTREYQPVVHFFPGADQQRLRVRDAALGIYDLGDRIELRKQSLELAQSSLRPLDLPIQRISGDEPRAGVPEISADRDRALEPIDRSSVIILDERHATGNPT